MSVTDVLEGRTPWSVDQADCLTWLASLPADSVDAAVFSPPYEKARLYAEVQFNLSGQAWVDWMLKVFWECRRVCRGLVACVCEGQTTDFRYSAVPALLMADLHRAGFNLRKPAIYHRVGIPGSGGPDWLRNDYEFVVCTTRSGKLPWSDNTACGHVPKWAPGGEMSNRLSDGSRRNQWGRLGDGTGSRKADGTKDNRKRPSSVVKSKKGRHAVANPGNLIEQTYTAAQVAAMLQEQGEIIKCKVGGGQMGEGDKFAAQGEAPYPEKLAQFFILSFCPPGGIVLDCFSGSGTTLAVSIRESRRFIGCDLRASQVALSKKRILTETPTALFT